MDIFSTYGTILIIMAASFGFFMAWGVGANDVANAMDQRIGTLRCVRTSSVLVRHRSHRGWGRVLTEAEVRRCRVPHAASAVAEP